MRNLLYVIAVLLISMPVMAQTETSETTEETSATTARTAASVYNEAAGKMRLKDYAAAYPLFEEAIRMANINPTDSTNMKTLRLANKNGARAAYGYSNALYKIPKYDEMLTVATRGTEMDDDYFANYVNIARAHEKLDNKKEAVNAYLKAATFSEEAKRPEDKTASLYRKAFYKLYKDKNFDAILKKVAEYEGALAVADINYYVAKAHASKGATDKAITHAAKAAEQGKNAKSLGKFNFYLGDLYRKATKVDKALEAYKQVPKDSKYYSQAQYNITKLQS